MQCSHCNQPVENPEALFCAQCGQRLESRERCLSCGKSYTTGARFCERCGTPVGSIAAVAWGIRYCKASGSAILPETPHFKCRTCNNLFLENFRYRDQPLCLECAAALPGEALSGEEGELADLRGRIREELDRRLAEVRVERVIG
ncbi:MAG: zinc ribbon domain-containing protein [Candidatus Sedimenticola endophacoides]